MKRALCNDCGKDIHGLKYCDELHETKCKQCIRMQDASRDSENPINAYKSINCKICSKYQLDSHGISRIFFFKVNKDSKSFEFFCEPCSKRCHSSAHESRNNFARVNQSEIDGKNRCVVCENMFIRNLKEDKERKPKENLEKSKEYKKCQSRLHEEKNNNLPVNSSVFDRKNRCSACESEFLRQLIEEKIALNEFLSK